MIANPFVVKSGGGTGTGTGSGGNTPGTGTGAVMREITFNEAAEYLTRASELTGAIIVQLCDGNGLPTAFNFSIMFPLLSGECRGWSFSSDTGEVQFFSYCDPDGGNVENNEDGSSAFFMDNYQCSLYVSNIGFWCDMEDKSNSHVDESDTETFKFYAIGLD